MTSSKSSTKPAKFAQPYITGAANALQGAYNANQGQAASNAAAVNSLIPGLAEKAAGTSPLLSAANQYATDVLSGRYLDQGNPYLQGMIDQTDRSVTDRVNSQFGAAGRTGGAQHYQGLATDLANAENQIRYQDYGNERNAMGQALGLAPGLEQAGYSGVNSLLQAAQLGTTLPLTNAQAYASGVGSLLSPYQTRTQTPSLLDSATQIAGLGLTLFNPFGGK